MVKVISIRPCQVKTGGISGGDGNNVFYPDKNWFLSIKNKENRPLVIIDSLMDTSHVCCCKKTPPCFGPHRTKTCLSLNFTYRCIWSETGWPCNPRCTQRQQEHTPYFCSSKGG